MKKILTCLTLTTCLLSAKAYIGGQIGLSILNNTAQTKGDDFINGNTRYRFTNEASFKNNAFMAGFLLGWSFEKKGVFQPFLEADYSYSGSKKTKHNLDYYEDGRNTDNDLRKERISVAIKHSFGFMPGINIAITDKLSGLLGIRFAMTQFEVSGAHVTGNTDLIRSDNSKKSKAFIFGVEPTIGAKYDFTNNFSARVTVGYHVGQKKKVVNNYIGQPLLTNDGINAGISIRPRGVVVKAALIYTF